MKAIVKLSQAITLEIDDKSEMDVLHKAVVLAHPRGKCNLCESTGPFMLISNKDKEGNTYINNLCISCGAKSKLGQYKAGGGYFWREFEKYVPKVKGLTDE